MSNAAKTNVSSHLNDEKMELTWISFDQTVEETPLNDSLVKPKKGNISSRPLNSGRHEELRKSLTNMLSSRYSLEVLLDCWLEEYSRDNEKGLVLLFQSLLSYCGAELQSSDSVMQTKYYNSLFEDVRIPLRGKCPFSTKKTREQAEVIIADFFAVLIRKSKASHLFDNCLLSELTSFLVAFSRSSVRHFRHTGTFAGQISKYGDCSLSSSGNEASLSVLNLKKNLVEDRTRWVTQVIDEIVSHVFTIRYRDIIPEIRALCIEELTQWLSLMPERFLSVDFLKYLVWSLIDEAPTVRFNCLSALLLVFIENRISPEISCYFSSVKNFLLSRIYDTDVNVASVASCLLVEMERDFEGFLETDYLKKICSLVFCNVLELAVSAGKLLVIKLSKSFYAEEITMISESLSDDKRFLLAIAYFYANSEHIGKADLLVDAIAESCPILWKLDLMAELLLDDRIEDLSEPLTDILMSSTKQLLLGYRPDRSKKQNAHCLPSNLDDCPFSINKLFLNIALLIRKHVKNLKNLERFLLLTVHSSSVMRVRKALDVTVLKELVVALGEVVGSKADVSMEPSSIVIKLIRELIDMHIPELKEELSKLCNLQKVNEEEAPKILFLIQICSFLIRFMEQYDHVLWKFIDQVLNNISRNIPIGVYVKLLQLQFVMLCWELRMIYKQNLSGQKKAEVVQQLKTHEDCFLESVCCFFKLTLESNDEIPDLLIQWLAIRHDFTLKGLGLLSINKLQKWLFCNILNLNSFRLELLMHVFFKFWVEDVFGEYREEPSLNCEHIRQNLETKNLLQNIMQKMAETDCYGFAKAISQSLMVCFLKVHCADVPTVLELANDFIKFLKMNFRKTVLYEMVSFVMKDGLIFTFAEITGRIKYLNILSRFSALLSQTYQKSIITFLKELDGQEVVNHQCYKSLLASLNSNSA